MTTLSLEQFRTAWKAGEVSRVCVLGSGGLFFVTGQARSGDRVTLATTRGKTVRGFRDAGKAIAVLHDLGARQIEVDTSAWLPERVGLDGRRRPDTAARQQRAHEAVGHDAWFRDEVARSLQEADASDADWLSNDAVLRQGADSRAVWRSRLEPRRKPD